MRWLNEAWKLLFARGCAVVCLPMIYWLWGAVLLGFLLGWIGHARLARYREEEGETSVSPHKGSLSATSTGEGVNTGDAQAEHEERQGRGLGDTDRRRTEGPGHAPREGG